LGVNCGKSLNYRIWMTMESFLTLFHMNGGVICFIGQLRPTKMLFKHSLNIQQFFDDPSFTGHPLELKDFKYTFVEEIEKSDIF
jgi:hypothetical protein